MTAAIEPPLTGPGSRGPGAGGRRAHGAVLRWAGVDDDGIAAVTGAPEEAS